MSEHRSHRKRRTRRRHGRAYRIKRWMRHRRRTLIAVAALICCVTAGMGSWMYQVQKEQRARQVTAGNSYDAGSGYRNLVYNGKEYQFNNLITTILYAGIDSTGEMKPSVKYTDAAGADSIAVVVLDKKNKRMSVIAINRDTMTEIRRYTLSGTDRGTYVSHLGYAYTYGEGGEVSCENLREAVSGLLGGIPIDEYVVTNMSSIPYINDLVGGVTLEVPNSDVEEQHPELTEGATVTLDDSNVYDYLHYRDITVDFSNEGRIERQQAYITAYAELMKEELNRDAEGVWNQLQDMEDYLQTSITKNKYIGLANLLVQTSFGDGDIYRPEGENVAGRLHDEFYIDEEALTELIIELFYEEI